MKRILLILMCALMLVSVTACGDKVKEKEDKSTEETKAPQKEDKDNDKESDNNDKDDASLGGKIEGYVDQSKKAVDDTSCDYLRSVVMSLAADEACYKEMSKKDGRMWLLVTFDDGMAFLSEEDFTALKEKLNEMLGDLEAPKGEGKVAYLVTWISDTGYVINFNAEAVDATLANSYEKASK